MLFRALSGVPDERHPPRRPAANHETVVKTKRTPQTIAEVRASPDYGG